jgi:cytochrome c oxidase assembly protein subunit 15
MAGVSTADTSTVTPSLPSGRRSLLDSLPIPSERTIRGLAIASLVSQIGIIVTGGAVRLTGSGLGCPEWPNCTGDSLSATPEMGVHGVIEFGNRMLTFVLGAIAALTLLAVWHTLRSNRPRRDLLGPAIFLILGIPAQAVIGGISVLTDLNPWVVMLHLMCSAVLVGMATVLVRRAQRPLGAEPDPLRSPWLARLGFATMAIAYVTVYLGTIVTGTGPHAGDPESPRTEFDLATVTQLHVHAVTLLVGLTIGLYIAARAAGSPGRLASAALVLLSVELTQGVVGVTQYALELPELLVGIHMLLAALLVAAAVDAWLASRFSTTSSAA